MSEAAGAEKWEDVRKAIQGLDDKIEELLVKQRDADLATLMEVGFWLRGLEVASGIIQADEEAPTSVLSELLSVIKPLMDVPLCASTDEVG